MFSLDLVKIVFSYLVCSTAIAGAKPKLLLTIESEGEAEGQINLLNLSWGVACSPVNTIWLCNGDKVSVFSDEGKFLHHAAEGQLKDADGIAIAQDGQAFIG